MINLRKKKKKKKKKLVIRETNLSKDPTLLILILIVGW